MEHSLHVGHMISMRNRQETPKTRVENSSDSAFKEQFRGSRGLVKTLVKATTFSAALLIASCANVQRTDVYHGQQPLSQSIGESRTTNPETRGKTEVISRIKDAKSEFFITIDDGWFTDPSILKLMKEQHVPITAFLISEAMKKHPDYWRAFRQCGGSEEDHTVDHPFLTKLAYPLIFSEIKGSEDDISRLIGEKPVMMRPPYGSYNADVLKAAAQAGIPSLVMWSEQINNTREGYTAKSLETYRQHLHLQSGDIVLLHWVPGLSNALELVMTKGREAGLKPGNLLDYLPKTEVNMTSSLR